MRIFTSAGPQVFLLSPEPPCEAARREGKKEKATWEAHCAGGRGAAGTWRISFLPSKEKQQTPFVGLDPGE